MSRELDGPALVDGGAGERTRQLAWGRRREVRPPRLRTESGTRGDQEEEQQAEERHDLFIGP